MVALTHGFSVAWNFLGYAISSAESRLEYNIIIFHPLSKSSTYMQLNVTTYTFFSQTRHRILWYFIIFTIHFLLAKIIGRFSSWGSGNTGHVTQLIYFDLCIYLLSHRQGFEMVSKFFQLETQREAKPFLGLSKG